MKSLSILVEPPQNFYIPARSSFILDTFPSASSALGAYTLNTSRFDLIILDPPWHNKAVSRLKTKKHLSYDTMRRTLAELPPVGNWLAGDGFVGIWCTNNLKMINQVKTILFKRWGVELIAEWVWLKVHLAAKAGLMLGDYSWNACG
jgi:N6-adenosine-specific RNA methylase IME4